MDTIAEQSTLPAVPPTKPKPTNRLSKHVEAPEVLSFNDTVFVNAYFEHGRSAIAAYRASHPKAKYSTCKAEAYRVLNKPCVKAEIAKRLQQTEVVTREFIQSHLLRALGLAEGDPKTITLVCRELGELAGLKVQKVEDVTKKDQVERQKVIEELRARGLVVSES